MGISCQILINRTTRGIHKPGAPVSGLARYTLDEPERYKDITISLIGKGKCSWSELNNNVNKRKQRVTYIGSEIYTAQYISLRPKESEGDFMLPIGIYERAFTFVLPNNIPSSFEDETCTIKYKIVLKFVRPGFLSVNKKFETEINVVGNVHSVTPEGKLTMTMEKTLFKPFCKRKHRVHLEAELPKTMFRPSETVPVNYKIINDTDLIVPSLKAEMICHRIYTADCGRRKERSKTIAECTVETTSVPDNAIANLSSTIYLPGYLYTIQQSRIIHNEYTIKVTLRLPMPHLNACMKLPIVVGEKYGDNYLELHVPETGDLEEPPPYFQVMKEQDKD